MKQNRWISVLSLVALGGCFFQSDTPRLEGEYLGQVPPGMEPELFAAGIVSTGMDELNAVFSPDGTGFYFSVKLPGDGRHTMMEMRLVDGRWTEPAIMPFSGQYADVDPAFHPDGERLFFVSRRPYGEVGEPKDWDIWFVRRTADSWGWPVPLPGAINTSRHEIHPSITRDGTIYFSSNREGGLGGFDLYSSRIENGIYVEPENLGATVNTDGGEGDVYVDSDESYLIFSASREDGYGRDDLVVSFRMPDGSWSQATNLGSAVNSPATEYSPQVTPDGNYLFFTSSRIPIVETPVRMKSYSDLAQKYLLPQNGQGDIYWVDTRLLDEMRTQQSQ